MEWYWWIIIWVSVGVGIFCIIGIVLVLGADEGFGPVILLLFLWPLIPFFIASQICIDYVLEKRKEKQRKREKAGWWELKEFGGKY